MRVAGFDYMDIADTDGLALCIYFQGCRHNCKGCHNKELQCFCGGEDYNIIELSDKVLYTMAQGDYDYVVLSGGDPLCQDHDEMRVFMQLLIRGGVKIWVYTGYDYVQVPDWCKRLAYCIKCGRYDTRFPKVGKLATGNQCYYFKDGRREY